MSYEPTRPLPAGWQGNYGYESAPPPRRRRRWPWISGITLLVLAGLAIGGDRVACAIAENQMASQVQQSGFPVKPHVTIEGFPFLTQLLAHDFNDVVMTASNVTEGPLVISSLTANLHGMHISGNYKSATIDTLDGSALVTFAALGNAAGGVAQGITLGPGPSPDEITMHVNLDVISTDVTAKVTRTSASQFRVHVLDAGGVPTDLLGNLLDFTVNVPKLPAGLAIQSVSVTQQGVLIEVVGHHTTLSQ